MAPAFCLVRICQQDLENVIASALGIIKESGTSMTQL